MNKHMDIKRTVLWVVFSLSILLLWDNWMRYTGKPSMFFPSANQQAKPAAGASPAAPAANGEVPQASATPAAAGAAAVPGATPAAAPAQGERVTITTDVLKAEIDSVGGELRRLELLKHKDAQDPTKNVVLFDSSPERTYLAQTGLIGGAFPNHRTPFTVQPGARSLDGGNEVKLVLTSEQGGVKLTKTYTFHRGDYLIDVKHDVTNLSGAPVSPSLYVQLLRDGGALPGDSKFYSTFTGPAVYTDADKFQKLAFDKIGSGKDNHATKADDGWIAMIQHYFVSAFVPPEKAPREIFTKKVDNLYAVGNILPLGTIAPGATVSMDTRLYSGPQESETLIKVAPGLELVKDYGWLTIVAKPIFWLMVQIHNVLGNWGWTIIVLTIMIKLLFFPLSAASYRSMAKMKLVTPKMTAIRERHKGDPQKMNQAMMELYKTEKINPLGGCFPILVQIPVFIALYWVLLAAIELRHAPFVLWIHDLSALDPYFVLPILMTVTMVLQTRMNPVPPDPVQAQVMKYMPFVFSIFFFFFPAGLVLYWLVNNILSILQQWQIQRMFDRDKPAHARR
jgi:YidC/Oxa1 family membrane protein insertase